jgi:hypothetical protein
LHNIGHTGIGGEVCKSFPDIRWNWTNLLRR